MTAGMDFSGPDRVDAKRFDDVLWYGMTGANPPG
jgi:hypothetical protein